MTPIRKVTYVALLILVFIAPGVYTCVFVVASQTSNSVLEDIKEAEEDRTKKQRQIVNEWLESQRKAQDGYRCWLKKPWVQPVHLFAVRDWEILDHPEVCEFIVRVHSSNRGGQPIINLWRIFVSGEGEPKIFSVEEACEAHSQEKD